MAVSFLPPAEKFRLLMALEDTSGSDHAVASAVATAGQIATWVRSTWGTSSRWKWEMRRYEEEVFTAFTAARHAYYGPIGATLPEAPFMTYREYLIKWITQDLSQSGVSSSDG